MRGLIYHYRKKKTTRNFRETIAHFVAKSSDFPGCNALSSNPSYWDRVCDDLKKCASFSDTQI